MQVVWVYHLFDVCPHVTERAPETPPVLSSRREGGNGGEVRVSLKEEGKLIGPHSDLSEIMERSSVNMVEGRKDGWRTMRADRFQLCEIRRLGDK